MKFIDKLRAAQVRTNSWLCVGLDTDPDRIPTVLQNRTDAAFAFNRAIIGATAGVACAYKPNLGFYLSQGSAGIDLLEQTVAAIPSDVPVVLDAKFGDIESSARAYAQFAFERLGADAVTLNPYLGADALAPFLQDDSRAAFVLAHTSNPGAHVWQDERLGDEPLYLRVARWAATLPGEVGLVVGATFPEQLSAVRATNPGALLLIPGVGAQGGGLAQAVEFGRNASGVGPLINSSRSVLYASSGEDFAQAAEAAATRIRDEINAQRGRVA